MNELYVETVHGDPTIWLRTPDNPNGDEPAMVRTGANARAFDALAALVEAAQERAEQVEEIAQAIERLCIVAEDDPLAVALEAVRIARGGAR